MAKIGISIKIDVSKIDKSRIFEGKKGKYIDLSTFIDLDNEDQYGNNGFISQSVSKDERQNGVQTPILGNCKVFYKDELNSSAYGEIPQSEGVHPNVTGQANSQGGGDFEDNIPFIQAERWTIA